MGFERPIAGFPAADRRGHGGFVGPVLRASRPVAFLAGIAACGPGHAPAPPADPRVAVSGPIACDDPQDGPLLSATTIGDDWAPLGADARFGEGGIVVADFDGDDRLDLLIPRMSYPSELWLGTPGGFAKSDQVLPDGALGGSAADADGDGDLDVLLLRATEDSLLLVNDGTGHLDVHPLDALHVDPPGCGGTASWADMDLDGDLDLFVGRLIFRNPDSSVQDCPSVLLENRGGLAFVDRSAMLPDDVQQAKTYASGWVQLDDDPWPELYAVGDVPRELPGNRVLDNDGGVLQMVEDHPLDFSIAGMGLALGDWNEDGITDLVVPGVFEIKAMISLAEAPGEWADAGQALGIVPRTGDGQESGWGGELVDLDDDGDLDLVLDFGALQDFQRETPTPDQPDELWLQQDDGTFAASGHAWGFDDPTKNRGTISVDLDRDGALDIVKRTWAGPVTILRQPCSDQGFIEFRLHDRGGNPDAVGARVAVAIGDRVLSRTVYAGSTSFESGGPPELHFGLGDADRVDAVEVTWPDGGVSTYGAIAGRQRVDLERAVGDWQ